MTARWTVVLPVKAPATAKTRLGLPDDERAALARAFALDTVAAALACRTVGTTVVVTDDAELAAELRVLGADVLDASLPLNAAIEAASRGRPGPVAAVPADVPALRPETLADALQVAGAHARAVVADRRAEGTVLLTALRAEDLSPSFGPRSFEVHRRSGAVPLTPRRWPDLRCDVDTAEDLAAARALGVGAATTRLLAPCRA